MLETQLKQTDSALTRAQAELSSFQVRLQIGSSQGKLAAEQNQLLALEDSRIKLEADRNTFNDLLGRLRNGNEQSRAEALRALAGSPALGDNPQVTELYQRLTRYQLQVDSMTTGRSAAAPNNPDLLALKSLIGQTQTQLTQAVSSHLGSIDSRISSKASAGAAASRSRYCRRSPWKRRNSPAESRRSAG